MSQTVTLAADYDYNGNQTTLACNIGGTNDFLDVSGHQDH
jgi:hypothetical protein